jgi:hypothetical protein
MNMRKVILLTIVLSETLTIFAQKGIELKIYQNTDVFKVDQYNTQGQLSSQQQTKFGRISFAVAFHTKTKFIHEIELFVPRIDESSNDIGLAMNYQLDDARTGQTRKTNAYSFRYEFAKEIRSTKNTIFSLGLGVNPFLAKAQYISSVPNTYNRYFEFYGASINFIPRFRYSLSNKALVELSIPFKMYDIEYVWQKIENPSIPIRQQSNDKWVNSFFENAFTVRLGFAYKL